MIFLAMWIAVAEPAHVDMDVQVASQTFVDTSKIEDEVCIEHQCESEQD